MRKETINTFSDGMSLDLNPLGTPAKTLTNCLNGTLITYNGNELTLQNDMGNVPVGTAVLPKGYVPVGIKEHGGIIYVASYNPETKKGLLGCFPSPLQIYTSEAALTILNINILEEFIDLINDNPFIKINEYKEEIFKDSLTQEAKIFNSGDLFIIKSDDNFNELLRLAIDENIIVLKLLVIPTSGGEVIDISSYENNDLNLYPENNEHKPLWIFQNGGRIYDNIDLPLSFDTIINEHREYLLSYPRNIGPGILLLVIEFNTFKLFNLYNKITKENGKYNVLFIGIAEPDDYDKCNIVNKSSISPISLFGSINFNNHVNKNDFKEILGSSTGLTAESNKWLVLMGQLLFYDILPACKWGIADDSFLKSGEISFNDIINFGNKIRHWSFEINDNEALIKWSFLRIQSEQTIDHFRFVFIPLDLVIDSEGNGLLKDTIDLMIINNSITKSSKYVYKITKPYFSGDFEDSFPIDDEHLSKNYIYLCRLDIVFTDGTFKNAVDYKLLYTGTFFNDKDINQFSYDNRPEVLIGIKTNILSTQNQSNIDYTILKEQNSEITKEAKDKIVANDIMFLADDNLTDKIIGATENIEYELLNNLNVTLNNTATYKEKTYNVQRSFAGNIEEVQFLDSIASNNKIKFNLKSNTEYRYNLEGDNAIELCKKDYIEVEEINGTVVNENSTLSFVKDASGTYTNSSKIKIHRGIISKLGLPEERPVVHQGLYPVYEENDVEYNEELFGFKLGDNDFISNCVHAKGDSINNYLKEIGPYGTDTNYYPYRDGATVQGNTLVIDDSMGYDEDTLEETLRKMGNKVINICVSTQQLDLTGDTPDSGFRSQLTMPHEISFSEKSNTGRVDIDHYENHHALDFKKNNLGYRNEKDKQAFFRPHDTKNCMTILWRTQYGPRLINVATPLNISEESTEDSIITIQKTNLDKVFSIYTSGTKYSFSEMHLRAEKLLLCMLSLILIAKCKNSVLNLNSPDILYSTEVFTNNFSLELNINKNVPLILNGKSIEQALSSIISNKVLDKQDAYLPKFKAADTSSSIQLTAPYNYDLARLFEGLEYPYFTTLTGDLIYNIYPGNITKIEKLYLCTLEKNYQGIYTINENLIHDDEFYKIFLPTLISQVNSPEKQFSCTNTDTYKFILEGFSYNKVLLPMTKIAKINGLEIKELRSLDSDDPLYNLLYYNALDSLEKNVGAVTLFGDQSAVINTLNFNNSEGYPEPTLDENFWKGSDVFKNDRTRTRIVE